MFSDGRSRKVMLIAHCILNHNCICGTAASVPATAEPIARTLIDAQVGLLQLPCPELQCIGLKRGLPESGAVDLLTENSRIRTVLEQPVHLAVIRELVGRTVLQVREYLDNGFAVLGVLGINRSPSCGIVTTSKGGAEVAGQGVFMGEMMRAFEREGWDIPFVGIKYKEMDKAVADIKALL